MLKDASTVSRSRGKNGYSSNQFQCISKSDSVDHEATQYCPLVCVGVQTGRRTRRDLKSVFVCLTVCFDKGSLFLKTVHLSHWVCGELTLKTKTALRPSRAHAGQSCFLSPIPLLVSKFSAWVFTQRVICACRLQVSLSVLFSSAGLRRRTWLHMSFCSWCC